MYYNVVKEYTCNILFVLLVAYKERYEIHYRTYLSVDVSNRVVIVVDDDLSHYPQGPLISVGKYAGSEVVDK